jgi:hypothetical protein
MEKKYTAKTSNRTPRPRSKRLREQGIGSKGGTVVLNATSNGSTGGGSVNNECSGLKNDLVTRTSVGYINSGVTLLKGMTCEEIFRLMFYKALEPTFTGTLEGSTDVEVGTPKTRITYTADKKDGGELTVVNMENGAENYAERFTGDGAVKTYVRELQTADSKYWEHSETYRATAFFDGVGKPFESTITVKTYRKWFAKSVAWTRDFKESDHLPKSSDDVRAFESQGTLSDTTTSIHFELKQDWVLVLVALPSELSIKDARQDTQPGFDMKGDITSAGNIEVSGATKGMNTATYKLYKLRTNAKNIKDGLTLKF